MKPRYLKPRYMKPPYWALPLVLLAATAQADPLDKAPMAFNPLSRTAQAITGPVIASDSRIIFGNGAQTALSPAGKVTAVWTFGGDAVAGQVLAIATDPGALMNGNRLCGGDRPRFLVASQVRSFGGWALTLAVFTGDSPPASIEAPGLCGTYGFGLDGPIGK